MKLGVLIGLMLIAAGVIFFGVKEDGIGYFSLLAGVWFTGRSICHEIFGYPEGDKLILPKHLKGRSTRS